MVIVWVRMFDKPLNYDHPFRFMDVITKYNKRNLSGSSVYALNLTCLSGWVTAKLTRLELTWIACVLAFS